MKNRLLQVTPTDIFLVSRDISPELTELEGLRVLSF